MTGPVSGGGTSGDNMPMVSPSPLTGDLQVVSEEAAWTARVIAADAAVVELRAAFATAHGALKVNYFGEGCVEGEDLYGRLKERLHGAGGFVEKLRAELKRAEDLRDACRAAHPRLAAVDEANGIPT